MSFRPEVHAAVRDRLGREPRTVEPLGAGLDNAAFLVDGRLVVRLRHDEPGRVLQEAAVLEAVRSVVAAPEVEFVDAELGLLAYPLVAGTTLLEVAGEDRARHAGRLGADIGEVLGRLHLLTPQLRSVVGTDPDGPPEWRTAAQQCVPQLAGLLSRAALARVERFLGDQAPPRATNLVFSHNDLGIEHVLVDPQTLGLTGIIDWTDAAVTDPAVDHGLLLRDLGPPAFETMLVTDPIDDPERAWYIARCAAVEDLAFGIVHHRASFVDKTMASFEWLFPR